MTQYERQDKPRLETDKSCLALEALAVALAATVAFGWVGACLAAGPSDAQLDECIFAGLPDRSATRSGPALTEIREQVERIVAADRHDLVGGRLWGTANQLLWGHGQAVAAISAALPLLDDELAAKAGAFLAADVDKFLLNEEHIATEVDGSLGTAEGVRNYGLRWRNNDAFRWDALYGLWAYAAATGDWQRIDDNWKTVLAIYRNCRLNCTRYCGGGASSNAAVISGIDSEIAGLSALARMARKVGDAAVEAQALRHARDRLRDKLAEMEKAEDFPVHLLGGGEAYTLHVIGYQDLTPELATFLGAHAGKKVKTQIDAITHRFGWWWLGDLDHVSDWMAHPPFPPVAGNVPRSRHPGEESFQMSLFADPIYMAKAYALRESADELARRLPLAQSSRTTPDYLDMFRLRHLVALAAAGPAKLTELDVIAKRAKAAKGSAIPGEGDWPMYNHDPQLSGRGEAGVLPARGDKLTPVWERQFPVAPHVRAQPIVVDGVIYQTFMGGTLRAIDVNTGKDIWWARGAWPIAGSACVTGGKVIAADLGGNVRAYGADGQPKWHVRTGQVFASPIAAEGVIYVGDLARTLWAISAADGKVLWKQRIGGRIPGPAAVKGGVIVVIADDLKAYAFDIAGEPLWAADLPGESVRHTHPVIGGRTVLLTTTARASDYGSLRGRKETDPAFYAKRPPAGTMLAVDLRTGRKAFEAPQSTPYWGQVTPVMLTPSLALKQARGKLWTIDVTSGEVKEVGKRPFRRDEDAYALIGAGRLYGAVADDLGVWDPKTGKSTTLVGDFWTHYVGQWRHDPDETNELTFIPGPGDGNSGYCGSPVCYEDKIIWLNCASWLSCHAGRAVKPPERGAQ